MTGPLGVERSARRLRSAEKGTSRAVWRFGVHGQHDGNDAPLLFTYTSAT
jgi:hypothetical protein